MIENDWKYTFTDMNTEEVFCIVVNPFNPGNRVSFNVCYILTSWALLKQLLGEWPTPTVGAKLILIQAIVCCSQAYYRPDFIYIISWIAINIFH